MNMFPATAALHIQWCHFSDTIDIYMHDIKRRDVATNNRKISWSKIHYYSSQGSMKIDYSYLRLAIIPMVIGHLRWEILV